MIDGQAAAFFLSLFPWTEQRKGILLQNATCFSAKIGSIAHLKESPHWFCALKIQKSRCFALIYVRGAQASPDDLLSGRRLQLSLRFEVCQSDTVVVVWPDWNVQPGQSCRQSRCHSDACNSRDGTDYAAGGAPSPSVQVCGGGMWPTTVRRFSRLRKKTRCCNQSVSNQPLDVEGRIFSFNLFCACNASKLD